MDYINLFRPIISMAAHARRADPGRDGASLSDTALRHIEAACDEALGARRRVGSRGFDAAWIAVGAWLAETVPETRPLVAQRSRGATGEAFFRKLDSLLDPGATDGLPAHERAAALKVYALCLDLGFRGPYAGTKTASLLEEYRRACRSGANAPDTLSAALAATFPHRPRRRIIPAASTLFRAASVAAVIVLYAAYRFMLSDLYAMVME